MRPLKLTLRGINSYRKEQTIDFEALTSAGLFGIFGPTGSGKSSILDAITLALYARLPRSTKNFININEETAAVSFLFSITTTETHQYQVERSFRYHKGNHSSTVRNTGASLADVTGEKPLILADRPTEVTQECIRLLGLTSEDFMRTVVLPQGQFSEFLKLKNAERRSMLQRIFHLEQYGLELTQKISSAKQKQELLLSNLEGQLQGYENVSGDSLNKMRQSHALLKEELKKTAEKKEAARQAFQEADAIRSLLLEYEPVRKKYEDCLRRQPAMEEKEKQLALGKKAAQVRPFALQAEKSAREAKQAEQAFADIQKQLKEQLAICENIQKEKEALSEKYSVLLPGLIQKEQDFRNAMERSRSIKNWNTSLKETERRQQENQQKLTVLQQKEADGRQREEQLQKELAEKEKVAAGIRPSREELHGLEEGHLLEETYREKRGHYEENKKEEQTQKQRLENELASLSSLKEQLRSLQSAARHSLAQHENDLSRICAHLRQLSETRESFEKELEELQEQHMALILRSHLRDKAPCPVCGQIHHADAAPEAVSLHDSFPDSSDADTAALTNIQKLQEQLRTLADREKELDSGKRTAEEQISAISAHLKTITDLLPEPAGRSEARPSEPSDPFSTAEISETSSLSGRPDTAVSAPDALRPEDIRRQLQELSSSFHASQARASQYEEQYSRLRKQNQEQYRKLQQEGNEILALRRQWNTENFTEALAGKREAEKKYDTLQEEILLLRQQLEEGRNNRESLTRECLSLSGEIATARSEALHYAALIKEEEQKFPEGYSVSDDFSALLEHTEEQRKQLEEKKETLDRQYQKETGLLQSRKEEASAAENQRQLCRKNQEQDEEMLKKQLDLAGFAPDADIKEACLSEETLAAMEEELHEFQETFSGTKERLSYLEEKRQNQNISEEEWAEKKESARQADLALEQQQKEEAVLLSEIKSCEEKLSRKQDLLSQHKEALHRRGLIRQLEQLFKGNAFIEYVSESRLRYIASEASVILSSISNGNYELEINENAEFVIRDNKNGGILRPCDTLSGGETFITSLSLALALSSVIQLNGTAPLELFFLDEGFGNLDDELLDVVMTSLERLQSTRRSIGIITHVEAIQARVPVKLIVTPSDVSQNGSTIRMEYS